MPTPRIVTLTRADLDKPPKNIHEILPTPLISRIRPLCALHGTTGAEVARLLESRAFEMDVDYCPPDYLRTSATDHGLFLGLVSGQLFDFEEGGKERQNTQCIRTHVLSTLQDAVFPSIVNLEKTANTSHRTEGLGLLILELKTSDLNLLRDDPDYSDQDYRKDPSAFCSKYLPKADFKDFGCHVIGAIVTDKETNRLFARVLKKRRNSEEPLLELLFSQGIGAIRLDNLLGQFSQTAIEMIVK